ncbi:MAG: Stage V sporulation protein E [Candidatus Uhrbacteria bacterium GW2011_GWD2_41_121]|uniref:Probable peptidoglycan glycosyltransferase FtsW n=1 Tax=Candidatus Uhrbacteria bacterium GW2011_GWC1_41_20 TaxID=1618983 RepID=A0A0G0XQQ1_9BACT|nr:MAG: Stage V sporulation protein E [Candidatus Uhrbacteria bacterium GW2011_GWE1_39_46]KKR63923.1 MAG: Stage V sporulation protein E [Candidatus Uhrbacteria bacterium GW2011_GWC2_40_450]KKR90165.1 MAG: Stage V sporulation protein E [Candidatus Uhrbacteria bacterium GW2011_GWD2_41_121]KKR96132.1 MAG: Stage V sporulation protein E [Candidatus Uhrbacteria bacterium GW2011_GWD1_41_16]KKR99215.1 MAG: Stage V sporulation protein E [Candidatus Uhrbacteria bacterium GW2011_GWC1_41_20]KKS05971.1 MAG
MKKDSGKIDHIFLLLILGLTIFGLLILASASGPVAYTDKFGDSFYFVKHQVLSGVLPGFVLMFLASIFPYQMYKKVAFPLLILSIALLILVFIPGIGTDFGTFANSWVQIGGLSFQPAEIVKLTFLIYLCAWMAQRAGGGKIQDFSEGLMPFLFIIGSIAGLILLQPDLGTLSIIGAVALIIYFVAGGSIKHLLAIGVGCVAAFFLLIQMSPYRAERLMTFLHPELDPQGIGYQINQALLAIGSGGWFGRGYGHSLQKYQYLPEVIGDSIFAVMAEELGFFFSMLFLIAFVIMILRGLELARNAPDKFGSYLIIGIVSWFGVQAFVNIGAMVGILPITGVPLPFLSYGGTALVVSLAAAGVVLNISKSVK